MLPFFVRARDVDPLNRIFLDCQSTAVGSNIKSVAGVPHLAGATIRAVSDCGDLGLLEVDVNGAFDVARDGVSRVTFGLPYLSHGRLLPLAPDMETGGTAGRSGKLHEVKFRGVGVTECFVGNIDDDPDLAEALFPPQSDVDGLVLMQSANGGTLLNGGWDEQGVMDFWTEGPFAFDVTGIDRVMTKGGH
jgi:hypothetical protein